MDESSEKRRKRLQAMRSEAASSQHSELLSPCSSSSSSTPLQNPMITNSNSNDPSPQLPRFDFYTDPMAAYSGAKRRESFSSPIRSPSPRPFPSNRPKAGPSNYHVTPTHHPPSHQFQMNQSLNQSPYPPPPHQSPNQNPYPPPPHQFQTNQPPNQNPYPSPPPQFQMNQPPNQSPWRSPIQFSTPYSTHGGGTPPHYAPNPNYLNNSGGGSPRHAFPPNYSASRGGGLPSPSFRHGGSPSPHSYSGRGTGWKSRGSGQSGGRGRGSYHDPSSGRYEASHFYLKTMVKDPWRKLKPIVGNILVPLSGSGSWLRKSIAAPKRARVVESGAKKSQLSLAESLALAMEEAVDDE